MKIVGFKTPKPKQFNYKPLFYDKRKEEMEERLKALSDPGQTEAEKLRHKIRNTWQVKDTRNKMLSKRTMYIYLLGVILIIYLVFFL